MTAPGGDLAVRRWRVPEAELTWSFGPTGGPGGQHANRSNTRAELRFDPAHSTAFPPAVRRRILERLGPRLVGGLVVVVADETRSQWRNRMAARRRLGELLVEASAPPPRPRRPTRPTRTAVEERLSGKRQRAEVKRTRRPPEAE